MVYMQSKKHLLATTIFSDLERQLHSGIALYDMIFNLKAIFQGKQI